MFERLPGLVADTSLAFWRERLQAQTGGSLRLAEVLPLDQVLHELAALRPRLGGGMRVLAGQCWVRRGTPAHHWHQDGALHHDFMRQCGGAPLPIVTLWIPLTPCGVDAPGLAWVRPALATLLTPAELDDAAVQRRFAAAIEHPPLTPGEALLFGGGLLHRTHVTPAMTQPRMSIELRFVPDGPLPPALHGEPLQRWP